MNSGDPAAFSPGDESICTDSPAHSLIRDGPISTRPAAAALADDDVPPLSAGAQPSTAGETAPPLLTQHMRQSTDCVLSQRPDFFPPSLGSIVSEGLFDIDESGKPPSLYVDVFDQAHSDHGSLGPDGEHIRTSSSVIDFKMHFTTTLSFPTKDDLVCWTRNIAKNLGFVITIKSADKLTSRSKPRVKLGCDRGGFKRLSQSSKGGINKVMRKSSSKRCGCPFALLGVRNAIGTEWNVVVTCGVHNHEMVHLEAHSYAGRLTEVEQKIVSDMYQAGVKPRKILTTLKQRDKTNSTVLRTLYNERVKMQKKELEGGTAMQYLYKCITECGYTSFNKLKVGSNHLESLFFAHSISIRLCKMFPTVFLMDCTYKTNRYRLPLLSIVGITSTNLSFYAAFIFMSNETEESYVWALNCFKSVLDQNALPNVLVTDRELALMNAIKVVFPTTKNILCKVHISRNILAHCKKFFSKGKDFENFLVDWHRLVDSKTECDFYSALTSTQNAYADKFPKVFSYIMSTWIEPFKEYFVAAWVDMFMHLNNTTTNRVESGHAQLKKFLEVSIGSLSTVWKRFDQMIILQITEIKKSFGQSSIQVRKEFRGILYAELLGRVSLPALEIIQKEVSKLQTGTTFVDDCMHTNRLTMGLPCAHELQPYITPNNSFPLWMIHNHWKQLQLLENDVDEEIKVECQVENDIDIELDGILKRYTNTNVVQKHEIKRKLREIMDPSSTLTIEPLLPSKLKGRPKGSYKQFHKDDKSTKRELSLFEHVLHKEKSAISIRPRKSSGNAKKLLLHIQREMPACISKYIIDVVDVMGDGHCGYRVISLAMGMGDDWKQVRNDISNEIKNNLTLYTDIYGYARCSELLLSLDCVVTPAPLDKWMTMPDMGLIVASCYNIRFVHFSKFQSFTFLPLQTAPPSFRRTVFIAFINGNHYVQLMMHGDCPLPPVFSSWKRYCNDIAAQWDLNG